ncbi:VWA domain-containing protein [Gordonia insulae]|uniref:VWFA domain-containing protein n=1 Tax=Gordonia insulae TaxID=2420509 RepID=A0A3G8JN11_9ACTN|nr:VWA domain-containing protein [Gordonia insulae]AZG46457.1 hypothetical protein D7316_03058 [Gordonia insulae]
MTTAHDTRDVDVDGAWREALRLWNISLHAPAVRDGDGARIGSFAWFSFPPAVHIDLTRASEVGAADHLESVFAHEIGHHVLAPSTRINQLKITHQMARSLTAGGVAAADVGDRARLLANLWCDIVINDRVVAMQRRCGRHGMIELWRTLTATTRSGPSGPSAMIDVMWWVIHRGYELLWSLPAGELCPPAPPPVEPPRGETDGTSGGGLRPGSPGNRSAADLRAELARITQVFPIADAQMLADLARSYATDPIGGALPCSMLLAPYLIDERDLDPGRSCGGVSMTAATAAELEEVLGDARMSEEPWHPGIGRVPSAAGLTGRSSGRTATGAGQGYGLAETLALYAGSPPDAVVSAWYQTRARVAVRPLRQRLRKPEQVDTIPGPDELWEIGDDLTDIDWPTTLARGTDVIAGVTTRRRSLLADEPDRTEQPVELDLYIDSSGSMPQPATESPAVLAGTIVALSVLSAGGHVRVTSFSGRALVSGTHGYTRNTVSVMAALTTYHGHGTVFPLDLLARRHPPRAENISTTHLLVLSDDGLESMFGRGQEQYAEVAAETRTRLATGTLVIIGAGRSVDEKADAAGYRVVHVDSIDQTPAVCARIAAGIAGWEADDDR